MDVQRLEQILQECLERLEALEHSRTAEEGDRQSAYSREYGDDRLCECGHPYYRHFDTYDGMAPVGCKYCQCHRFIEQEPTQGEPVEPKCDWNHIVQHQAIECLCGQVKVALDPPLPMHATNWQAVWAKHVGLQAPSPPAPTETRVEAIMAALNGVHVYLCEVNDNNAFILADDDALDRAERALNAYDRTLKGEAG